VSDASRRDEARFALGVTAAYGVILALLALRHEPWGDELNLWLIARDAPGWTAFQQIVDHGGHGRLWHTLQWLLARVTGSFAAAQALQWAIATTAVWIQARFAPFPRYARALLPLGLFPLLEYGVIARPYGLGMALWFAACAVWLAARWRPLRSAALLALLCNTTVYGVFAAAGMTAAAAVAWRRPGGRPPAGRLRAAAALLLLGVAVAGVHMKPSPTATWRAEWRTGWDTAQARETLHATTRVLAPALPARVKFRERHRLDERRGASAGLALAGLAGTALLLWPQPPALALWVATAVPTLAFSYAKDLLGGRHLGVLFLAFVGAIWIADVDPRGARRRRLREGVLTAALVLHAAAGLQAFATDWAQPFSASRNAGRWLRDHVPPEVPIVGHSHIFVTPVTYYLGRPIWYPDWEESGTFHYHRADARDATLDDAFAAARRLAAEAGGEAIVVSTRRPASPPLDAEELARFPDAIVRRETYSIYRVRAPAPR
jgi:hypothetical protein